MVTTTTDSPTTMPSPVIVTSSKVATKPLVTKAALEGQGKRVYDKGKAKPLVKGKEKHCQNNHQCHHNSQPFC